ncbi:shewanella-like protein phosphatase 1 [Lathyrus oleraceus]|uniref:Glycosylated integral ER membrane protein n=1 Tax=Pisum sativum TaxID=3888 RepID=A0A9D5B5S7_PEA|nr:shewanella-like protein phosphatase 1 [Pisum sativum]KAI5435053.1 Glycosylated integral ER membrane protein [Pisum sativum]
MASLCMNSSLPLSPSSHPRNLTQTSLSSSSSSSLFVDNNNNNHHHNSLRTTSTLKPIVVSGNPPTFVSAPGRTILAVGDLHGDLKQARSALEMAGVLSPDGQDLWTGGENVLVQLGDILDRGEDEIAILSLLRSLEKQAKENGGAVFQVNGNHETMNVEGDFRYVESGGFDECSDFMEYINNSEDDWEETFTGWVDVSEKWKGDRAMSTSNWGPWNLVKRQKGVIARSILFRPGGPLACELARHAVVLKVNDWVFCHGGLLPHHVAYGLERMNKEVSEWMRDPSKNDSTFQLPFIATRGYDSVVWNRLYSRDSPDLMDYEANQVCSILEETLQAVGAKAMVVGHTPQTTGVNCKYNCSIWRVDVGMSSGVLNSRPEVLEIIDDKARVIRSERDTYSELQAAAYT